MLICDRCKNLKSKSFDFKISGGKTDRKAKPSVVIDLHLCDECIGRLVKTMPKMFDSFRSEGADAEGT